MDSNVISNMPEPSDVSSSASASDSSSSRNLWKFIIIFLILAFLGYNIFTYLGQISIFFGSILERISTFLKKILAYFGYGVTETVKKNR